MRHESRILPRLYRSPTKILKTLKSSKSWFRPSFYYFATSILPTVLLYWLMSKESAKYEVKCPFIPPLIPPQAGGDQFPDKLSCKTCGFYCTNSLHERLYFAYPAFNPILLITLVCPCPNSPRLILDTPPCNVLYCLTEKEAVAWYDRQRQRRRSPRCLGLTLNPFALQQCPW